MHRFSIISSPLLLFLNSDLTTENKECKIILSEDAEASLRVVSPWVVSPLRRFDHHVVGRFAHVTHSLLRQ